MIKPLLFLVLVVITTVYCINVNAAKFSKDYFLTEINEGHAVEYFGKGKKKDWCK